MENLKKQVLTSLEGNNLFDSGDYVVHYGNDTFGYRVVFVGNKEECEKYIEREKDNVR